MVGINYTVFQMRKTEQHCLQNIEGKGLAQGLSHLES